MDRRLLIQLLGSSLAAPLAGWAQEKYPSKPITWVCPYAAGGNADSRSRQVAKVMGTMLGQPIIIDNKAGAGGNFGTEAIARAKPDGYTLGMGNFAPLAVNQALFKKLNFNPSTDCAIRCACTMGQRLSSLGSAFFPLSSTSSR